MSVGKFCIVVDDVYSVALNHLTICSQLRSSTYAATGLNPIMDLALRLITEEPPALEKALFSVGRPLKPPFLPVAPPGMFDS